eukprot:366126-Chlamydomonas_euryale.AAC.2
MGLLSHAAPVRATCLPARPCIKSCMQPSAAGAARQPATAGNNRQHQTATRTRTKRTNNTCNNNTRTSSCTNNTTQQYNGPAADNKCRDDKTRHAATRSAPVGSMRASVPRPSCGPARLSGTRTASASAAAAAEAAASAAAHSAWPQPLAHMPWVPHPTQAAVAAWPTWTLPLVPVQSLKPAAAAAAPAAARMHACVLPPGAAAAAAALQPEWLSHRPQNAHALLAQRPGPPEVAGRSAQLALVRQPPPGLTPAARPNAVIVSPLACSTGLRAATEAQRPGQTEQPQHLHGGDGSMLGWTWQLRC